MFGIKEIDLVTKTDKILWNIFEQQKRMIDLLEKLSPMRKDSEPVVKNNRDSEITTAARNVLKATNIKLPKSKLNDKKEVVKNNGTKRTRKATIGSNGDRG